LGGTKRIPGLFAIIAATNPDVNPVGNFLFIPLKTSLFVSYLYYIIITTSFFIEFGFPLVLAPRSGPPWLGQAETGRAGCLQRSQFSIGYRPLTIVKNKNPKPIINSKGQIVNCQRASYETQQNQQSHADFNNVTGRKKIRRR